MKGCDISECTLQGGDLARDEEGARRNRKEGLGALLAAQPRPPGLMKRLKGCAFIHCASHWSPGRARSRGERMQDVGLKCCAFFTCVPWALPKVNSRVLHLFSDSVSKFMFLTELYKQNICVEFAHCSQFSQMMFTAVFSTPSWFLICVAGLSCLYKVPSFSGSPACLALKGGPWPSLPVPVLLQCPPHFTPEKMGLPL